MTLTNEAIETCIRHCDEQWNGLKQKIRSGMKIHKAEQMLDEIHTRREALILELQRRH